MFKYIIKRLVMLIPVIIGISFICFFILSFSPGDPARLQLGPHASQAAIDQLRKQMGLNDPLIVQYGRYMVHAVQGDFGRSYITNEPVLKTFFSRFPVTLKLTTVAMIFSILLGIPIGLISATKKYSLFDNISMIFVLIATAMPSFWLGLMLILLFSLKLGWFPSGGYANLKSLILPAICQGTSFAAIVARMGRTSLLEEIGKDYVRTAEAKGLSKNAAIIRHALKNSLMPVITVVGIQFASLLGGSVLCETVFSLPGVGQLIVNSIRQKDIPVVLASVILMAIFFCIANLLVDIINAYIDPRTRSEYV